MDSDHSLPCIVVHDCNPSTREVDYFKTILGARRWWRSLLIERQRQAYLSEFVASLVYKS